MSISLVTIKGSQATPFLTPSGEISIGATTGSLAYISLAGVIKGIGTNISGTANSLTSGNATSTQTALFTSFFSGGIDIDSSLLMALTGNQAPNIPGGIVIDTTLSGPDITGDYLNMQVEGALSGKLLFLEYIPAASGTSALAIQFNDSLDMTLLSQGSPPSNGDVIGTSSGFAFANNGSACVITTTVNGGTTWITQQFLSSDTGWVANSTVGDKTAVVPAYTAGLNGTMITALNTISAGTGTALQNDETQIGFLTKKLAALETVLKNKQLPNN